jgi:dolichyl-phosphate-mannose-protein mannosyltransferase
MRRHDLKSVTVLHGSRFVPDHSTSRNAVTAVIIFFAAHFALLVGVTTPEKFYFDEVHYVPAARQMLEPVMSAPMLNPMHPPLAKQLMALSIRTFGDVPLGWRYPSVLERVRLIQVMPAMKIRDILDKP